MATIVYQYGLLPPTRNAELVNDQMRLAHRYRNVLVEIERDRRTQVSAILVHFEHGSQQLSVEATTVARYLQRLEHRPELPISLLGLELITSLLCHERHIFNTPSYPNRPVM